MVGRVSNAVINTSFSRQACAEKISVNEDCSIAQVGISSCGLNGGPLAASGEYPAPGTVKGVFLIKTGLDEKSIREISVAASREWKSFNGRVDLSGVYPLVFQFKGRGIGGRG